MGVWLLTGCCGVGWGFSLWSVRQRRKNWGPAGGGGGVNKKRYLGGTDASESVGVLSGEEAFVCGRSGRGIKRRQFPGDGYAKRG